MDHFEYFFLDESFNKQYDNDKRFDILFTLFTVIAVFIACLGLLGMISYAMVRRTKEIGIRKAIGAGNMQILMLLGHETIVWVFVSFLIAVPVSWYLMHRWLQGYAYRTTLDWWIFAVAGSITMLVAVSTVLWRSY